MLTASCTCGFVLIFFVMADFRFARPTRRRRSNGGWIGCRSGCRPTWWSWCTSRRSTRSSGCWPPTSSTCTSAPRAYSTPTTAAPTWTRSGRSIRLCRTPPRADCRWPTSSSTPGPLILSFCLSFSFCRLSHYHTTSDRQGFHNSKGLICFFPTATYCVSEIWISFLFCGGIEPTKKNSFCRVFSISGNSSVAYFLVVFFSIPLKPKRMS